MNDNQNKTCPCGHVFIYPPADCGASGYAVIPDGTRICYACAEKREIDGLKDRSKPFVAYVAMDGIHITTWTGGKLMKIVSARKCKLTRQSFTHSANSYASIRAKDLHGNLWHGRGSTGIAIKLRPMKG